MRKSRLTFMILIICIVLVGCTSKEMKDAEDFLSLKDWENAIEKIQLEIKNNPKNVAAYKLLFTAQRGLYFDGYDLNNFLNPIKATSDNFPNLNAEGATRLVTILERIDRIDPSALEPEYLFFMALFNYYGWQKEASSLVEAETGRLEQLRLQVELHENRCDNEYIKESVRYFQKCGQTKSAVADNAYFWVYSLQCDTSYNVADFITDFRQKYKNSDLDDEVDLLEFREELRSTIDKYKDKPNPTSIDIPIELSSSFLEAHPNLQSGIETTGNLMVDYVVKSNREYNYDEGIYIYSNADGLIEYLKSLAKADLNESIKIKAMENIAEYYKYAKETKKQIETYQKLLDFSLSDDKYDDIHGEIGCAFQYNKDYEKAVVYLKQIKNPTGMQKYALWECYRKLGKTSEADKLQEELEKSTDSTLRFLVQFNSKRADLKSMKIKGLDAEFDTHSIKVKGYVVNNLPKTVRNVKVLAEVSDQYGNNTKESYDYIDIIYSGKKSSFEITFYYGNNCPSSIKYAARTVDYSK